jgi:hypothetical protein
MRALPLVGERADVEGIRVGALCSLIDLSCVSAPPTMESAGDEVGIGEPQVRVLLPLAFRVRVSKSPSPISVFRVWVSGSCARVKDLINFPFSLLFLCLTCG